MASKPNTPITTNHTYFNAIFNDYDNRIPTATIENFKKIGDLIMDRPNTKNEFINALFNKIGLTLLQNKKYTSRLDIFSKGKLEYGETIEQKKAFEYWKQIPVEAPKKEEVKDNKSETIDSLLDKLLF